MSGVRLDVDSIARHSRLGRRISDLETGVTKPSVHLGGYGRNTRWHQTSLRDDCKTDPDTELWWRVRADTVFWKTINGAILLPDASTTNPLCRVAEAARPSHWAPVTSSDKGTGLLMHPDGHLYYRAGSLGPFYLSGGLHLVG